MNERERSEVEACPESPTSERGSPGLERKGRSVGSPFLVGSRTVEGALAAFALAGDVALSSRVSTRAVDLAEAEAAAGDRVRDGEGKLGEGGEADFFGFW